VWDDRDVRHGIVEGEPGIFPSPIARLFQAIGRLFGRRSGPPRAEPPAGDAPSGDTATDLSDLDPVRPEPDAQPRDDA
jgi:hypothetical protein